jgi:hypothetical protein
VQFPSQIGSQVLVQETEPDSQSSHDSKPLSNTHPVPTSFGESITPSPQKLSIIHNEEHQSWSIRFPSSHVSHSATIPSPHVLVNGQHSNTPSLHVPQSLQENHVEQLNSPHDVHPVK